MAHEAEFLAKVAAGGFRVDPDGSIWRLKKIWRTGRSRDIEPTRAEIAGVRGYLVVVLGGARRIQAHRAVFVALTGPLEPGQELNHRNGCRSDNAPFNLEIATRSENNQHSYDVLGRSRQQGERNGGAKLTAEQVASIREAKGVSSSRALGRLYGVSKTAITRIWSGQKWASGDGAPS